MSTIRHNAPISASFAIAKLAIRTALHSKIILWLFSGIVCATTVLPHFLKGDGSPIGQMRIIITYPLAISFIILLLGNLWLAAGLISLDISGKEIQSIVVKPIRSLEIWTGKWLALLAINIIMVAVVGLGIIFSTTIISSNYKGNVSTTEMIHQQIFTARRAIQIEPIHNIQEKAEILRKKLIQQRIIPGNTPISKICGELKAARSMAEPGKTISWTINIPSSLREQLSPASLRYKFGCNPMERQPISGTWTIESPNSQSIHIPVHNLIDGIHHLMLPESFRLSGKTVKISFTHIQPPDTKTDSPQSTDQEPSSIIYFSPESPVELLIHESSFIMNLIRSMLAIFCLLASIAAVGLTMSTLFSFPVAIFATTAIIFSVTIASSFSEEPVDHHHKPIHNPAKIIQITEPFLLYIKHATSNIVTNIPISNVANGMIFSWKQTSECIIILLLLIPAILAIVSSLILSQKELAL